MRSVLVIIISIILFSCHSGEQYNLSMKMSKGSGFTQMTESVTRMNMFGQNMESTSGMIMSFLVTDSNSEKRELTCTYKDINISQKSSMPTSLNSDSLTKKTKERLLGKSIKIILDNKNKIEDINGSEILIDTTFDNPIAKNALKSIVSKDQVKAMWGLMFDAYPGKPVRIGDVWKRKTETNVGGLIMKIDYNYKLTEVKDGVAQLEVKGVIDSDGDITILPVAMKTKMSGTHNGKMYITLADGYLKNSETLMKMKAEMELGGMKMPFETEVTTSSKRLE